jgi:hypothetical protein
MSLSQELAKGRSADQVGLQIANFAGGDDRTITSTKGGGFNGSSPRIILMMGWS